MSLPVTDNPNILFVFADQWRAQATGFTGDPNARTPNLDAFAAESVNFTTAVAGCPVCSPYRASLLTGQYPHTHGLVVNDHGITSEHVGFGDALASAGYDTGYIGKWHITKHDRTRYIRPDERMGFRFWRGFGCTHNYNHSHYYADDDPTPRVWDGYDASAQTDEAIRWMRGEDREPGKPFAMVLSWGPPHAPYDTAPAEYRQRLSAEDVILRPNVSKDVAEKARAQLAGYYAHIAALDDCWGRLMRAIDEMGPADDTIVVFTSDHGDMLGCQGLWKKQWPYDESILVPLLVRAPGRMGPGARTDPTPINAPDLMPTVLGLAGAEIPKTVEGVDFSGRVRGEADTHDGGALLSCYRPFHQVKYTPDFQGFRGLRTERYTYARTQSGPWLLLDSQADPYQMTNLLHDPAHADLAERLDADLSARLARLGDDETYGDEVVARYGIKLDENNDTYNEWNFDGFP